MLADARLLTNGGTVSGQNAHVTDSLLSGQTGKSPARQICENLRKRILGPLSGTRYDAFFKRHSDDELFGLFRKCTQDHIWTNCVEGHRATDPTFLHSLSEDYATFPPGWYLIFLWDRKDIQLWKDYVGQAMIVKFRGESHKQLVLNKPNPPLLSIHGEVANTFP